MEKALAYEKLRKPFMINELEMESVLKDRRKVYKTLQSNGIAVPFHVFCEREDPNVQNIVEEYDEVIFIRY
jgi:inositol hexakisphosphate/diphosphoinositol-pentakisphosphate kinase